MFTTKYVKVIDKDRAIDSELYNKVFIVNHINYIDSIISFDFEDIERRLFFSNLIESTQEEYEAQNQPQLKVGDEITIKTKDNLEIKAKII